MIFLTQFEGLTWRVGYNLVLRGTLDTLMCLLGACTGSYLGVSGSLSELDHFDLHFVIVFIEVKGAGEIFEFVIDYVGGLFLVGGLVILTI